MGKHPRLAFVSPVIGGGSTTFLVNLAGELTRRGAPNIIISLEGENPHAADFERVGAKVHLYDDRELIYEDRLEATLNTLREFRPDVVVSCLGMGSYEVLRYVPRGVRRAAMLHSDEPQFYEALIPFAEYADDIVCVSKVIAEKAEKEPAFSQAKKVCLLCGVAIPPTMPARGRTEGPIKIVYFGRLIKRQKRVHLFPQILAQLKESGIPFHWIIAGDGSERQLLEQTMPLDVPRQRVEVIGPIANAEIAKLCAWSDIYLLASDAEGLPVSLLEAMGQGATPVTTDLESGIREVLDATNGVLVNVDDIEGYAKAIIHLHRHREELAARSASSYARVKAMFSVEAMTDRWLNYFQGLAVAATWPEEWEFKAPLFTAHQGMFSPATRLPRRVLKKLRHALEKRTRYSPSAGR